MLKHAVVTGQVSAGTSGTRTMDSPAQLCVSDTNVLNTKTQANVAGYN